MSAKVSGVTGRSGSRLVVDVSVVVPGFRVDAQFEAPSGITVLSGPSGSGKSLSLHAVAGTVRPERGTITCGGVVYVDTARGVHLRSQDRRLGMVYQHAALLDHRSPVENVALAVREGDRASKRVAAFGMLHQVGAHALVDAKTRSLSGGERQRVALARALAGKPSVLLLDEPFSSLDAESREQMRSLLRTLVTERQVIALVVTHDQADVDALADRIVHYEPGRTVSAAG